MTLLSHKLSDYCVIDTETTGLNVDECELLVVCALKVINGCVVDRFQMYAKPKSPIPPEITAINKIRDIDVKYAPHPSFVTKQLRTFIGDMLLIGHNIKFDLSFLNKNSDNLFNGLSYIDTRELSFCLLKDRLANYSQSSLESHFEIKNAKKHSATGDAEALQKIFEKLLTGHPAHIFAQYIRN